MSGVIQNKVGFSGGISVAELLGREVVVLHSPASFDLLRGKTVLVTGAAGSIGSELCRQLLEYEPELVIALDTNETGLFDLREVLHLYPGGSRLRVQLGDITDLVNIEHLLQRYRPQIIFHVAAYKHVSLLEQYPEQAARINILGTFHLSRLARKYEAERFVFISTDKAAEPTSVMGASKRVGELIMQSLVRSDGHNTRFSAVRFGNVIGSRGSVVPIFTRQIERGGPITVTDPQATRYFMTIPEACGLVILSASLAEAGKIYLLDMGEPVRIVDLAQKMILAHKREGQRKIPIQYIGLRPGERLHEQLVASDEKLYATSHDKIFSITSKEELPSLEMITLWTRKLEEGLSNGSVEQLHQLVFSFVRQRSTITVHP
jgi:FlaA1/EpsC-like NDP-sugar epimerase